MRNLTKFLFVAAVVSACAQGATKKEGRSPPAPAASAPQGLFNKWQQEYTTTVIDLTGGSLKAEFTFRFLPAKGGTCQCMMDFKGGTPEGGPSTMSDCEYRDGSASPNADPGCDTLNGKYTYSSNGTSLSFTNVETKVTTIFRGKGSGAQDTATVLAK